MGIGGLNGAVLGTCGLVLVACSGDPANGATAKPDATEVASDVMDATAETPGPEAQDANLDRDAADAAAESGGDASGDAYDDAEAGCALGAVRCNGSVLEQCNGAQTGFELVADCAPWDCDEAAGQCAVCAPLSVACANPTTRRACAPDGLSYDDTFCPVAAPFCVGAGECVACRDESDCPSPAGECEIALCEQGLCSLVPSLPGAACGADSFCNGAGVCGACVPGQQRCAGAIVERCSDAGVWVDEEACPFVCVNGACAGECLPGERDCLGETPRLCDTQASWVTKPVCSGTQPECFDGQCVHATPPSCAGLATDCGANQDERCCAAVTLPGGAYVRSYDGVCFMDSSHLAEVSSFGLDLFEVTVGRFRSFLESGSATQASPPQEGTGQHPAVEDSGWQAEWNDYLEGDTVALRQELLCSPTLATWTDTPGQNERRPINCVTWFEAFAFCAWDGGRLATEAEWNFVASGGDDQRVYPWSTPPASTAISPDKASYWENGTMQCAGDGVPGCSLEDIVFVGVKQNGLGRWGHDALAGNVWEWVLDVYANPYPDTTCYDCAYLGDPSDDRVLRGGSFFGNESTLYASGRNPATPTHRYYTVGIRCARSLE